MDIIQCLYNETADRMHRKKIASPDYKKLLLGYEEVMEKLEAELTTEQKSIFLDVECKRNLLGAEDEEWMFQCGFRMGVKLMAETLLLSE